MGTSDFSGVSQNDVTPGADVHTPTHWVREESFWRNNWERRPYVRADRGYDYYSPGFRYGYESAHRLRGREWSDVEQELSSGWETYEHRGESKWEELKEAVRDAWHHVTGREHDEHVRADRDAERR